MTVDKTVVPVGRGIDAACSAQGSYQEPLTYAWRAVQNGWNTATRSYDSSLPPVDTGSIRPADQPTTRWTAYRPARADMEGPVRLSCVVTDANGEQATADAPPIAVYIPGMPVPDPFPGTWTTVAGSEAPEPQAPEPVTGPGGEPDPNPGGNGNQPGGQGGDPEPGPGGQGEEPGGPGGQGGPDGIELPEEPEPEVIEPPEPEPEPEVVEPVEERDTDLVGVAVRSQRRASSRSPTARPLPTRSSSKGRRRTTSPSPSRRTSARRACRPPRPPWSSPWTTGTGRSASRYRPR